MPTKFFISDELDDFVFANHFSQPPLLSDVSQ